MRNSHVDKEKASPTTTMDKVISERFQLMMVIMWCCKKKEFKVWEKNRRHAKEIHIFSIHTWNILYAFMIRRSILDMCLLKMMCKVDMKKVLLHTLMYNSDMLCGIKFCVLEYVTCNCLAIFLVCAKICVYDTLGICI